MKKVFFSFAIATMMASLVACGGQSGQNAEGQDSTAVEAEAEAAAEPEVIKDIHGIFSFEVPAGWEGESKSYASILRLPAEEAGASKVSLEINTTSVPFDETQPMTYGLTAENKVAEEQIGDYTWTIYMKESDGTNLYYAVAPRTDRDGIIYARGNSRGGYDENLKLGLKGIKLLK